MAELVRDEDPPVPVCLGVRLGVHLGEDHRGVDVARLVRQPEVEREVGPVVGKRVEDLLKALGEGHARSLPPARGAWHLGSDDADRAREALAQDVLGAADRHVERPLERVAAGDLEL